MPNCQTHVASVLDILRRESIQREAGWLLNPGPRAAFFLGAISPDVRAISGHTREETHFFPIPIPPGHPGAPDIMLQAYPALREIPRRSRPEQAAFIAGYIAHLVMDVVWLDRIVMRGLYVNGEVWGIHHPRWPLYSILMTYLEYQADALLPRDTFQVLRSVQPRNWLPFISDLHLADWRDRVVERVLAGGARGVSVMFSRSNGLTSDQMEAIVTSEERMTEVAYATVPRAWIDEFYQEADDQSEALILAYLRALP